MKRRFITAATTFCMIGATALFATDKWSANDVYASSGTQVEHNGKVYENKWWTKGEEPGTTGQWGVWKAVEGVQPAIPDTSGDSQEEEVTGTGWDPSAVYLGGDQVAHNGVVYEAKWWTQGVEPGTTGEWGVWKVVESTSVNPTPTPEPEPTPEPQPEQEPVEPIVPDVPVNPVNLEKDVAGYFAEWGIYGRDYQVTDIPVEHITHIYYAFLNINPTTHKAEVWDSYAAVEKRFPKVKTEYGTYEAGDWNGEKSYYGNIERLNQLDELVLNHYNKDIKLMFAVGGWTGSKDFPAMLATAETRKAFIDSLVEVLEKYKFEGICLDYEYPVLGPQFSYGEDFKYEESTQMVALVKEMKAAFDQLKSKTGVDYEIATAINLKENSLKDLDVKGISDYSDLHVMTYDVTAVSWGAPAGHQSPIYHNPDNPASQSDPTFKQGTVNASTKYLISKGVPRNKIHIGAPAYGRSGANVLALFTEGEKDSAGTWENATYDYDSVMGKSAKLNVPYSASFFHWDDVAKASYYLNDEGLFISYDSPMAVKEKANYINEQDLAGMFFWEFSGDKEGDLFKTANDNLNPGKSL